jgi:hypothetical protein
MVSWDVIEDPFLALFRAIVCHFASLAIISVMKVSGHLALTIVCLKMTQKG